MKLETIKQLSHLGLCVSYDTTLATIDKIKSSFDSAALKLKADMEEELQKAIPATPERNDDAELSMALSATTPNIDKELAELSDEETVLYSEAEDQSIVMAGHSLQISHMSVGEEEEKEEEEELPPDNDNDDIEQMDLSQIHAVETDVDQCKVSPPSFTMCWDNVGKKVVTLRPTENFKKHLP